MVKLPYLITSYDCSHSPVLNQQSESDNNEATFTIIKEQQARLSHLRMMAVTRGVPFAAAPFPICVGSEPHEIAMVGSSKPCVFWSPVQYFFNIITYRFLVLYNSIIAVVLAIVRQALHDS